MASSERRAGEMDPLRALSYGGSMVSRRDMARMAMAYDTQMAHAFRRALFIDCTFGWLGRWRSIMSGWRRLRESHAYDGLEECMAEEDEPGAWREARSNGRRR